MAYFFYSQQQSFQFLISVLLPAVQICFPGLSDILESNGIDFSGRAGNLITNTEIVYFINFADKRCGVQDSLSVITVTRSLGSSQGKLQLHYETFG
jgi:hypothetical protein